MIDMVMISAATARAMAVKEMIEISATPPCWRLVSR